MIFKGLKRNAIKKRIESHLQKREGKSTTVSGIKSMGVLIDASKPVKILSLLKLANELGVKSDALKIMGYKEDPKVVEEDQDTSYYSENSIGANGSLKSNSLQEFVNADFDVLISFYKEEKLELNYIAAITKAKFKVGLSTIDHRINDLVIGTPIEDTDLFIAELKKYLKILQII